MKRMRAPVTVTLLAIIAAVTVGCGVGDPYDESTAEGGGGRPPANDEAAKRPASDPEAGQPPTEVVLATPQATLRYAATLAGNWKGDGAVPAFAKLAALSTGAARARFSKLASDAELNVEAAVGYSRSQASVEAVSVKGRGDFREAVVVTRQLISSSELAHLPPEYKVILATVTRWGDGWAISSWEPQP